MVSYGAKVGIGDTLVDAITDMVGTTPPPDTAATATATTTATGSNHQPAKGARPRLTRCWRRRRRDFDAADQALADGKGAEWVRLNHQARAEVAKALNLLQ